MKIGDTVKIYPLDFRTMEHDRNNAVYGFLGKITGVGSHGYKVRVPYNNNVGFLEWWFDGRELVPVFTH